MEEGRIGILTFHCSDNYGAMLQAYALKKYLLLEGIKAAIVPYAPPFMTGRHWWFPYVPNKGWAGCLEWAYGWKMHLSMRGDFFRQRANMKYFRRKYLTEEGKRTLYLSSQLKELAYSYYIVGSDQIWNPVITCGLRKEYFGAFGNRYKKKVIAYAASLGGVKLAAEYEEQLAELLSHVDAVSVREEEAVSYIQKFYQGEVLAVLDPVFLLEKEQWQEIEKIREEDGYVLVYLTEENRELDDYAERLARKRNLAVIELGLNKRKTDMRWRTDYTAGPAEFLGYIHKADYVVTNSFHAIAFSILYRKQFIAFVHRTFGSRTQNILNICGLENRIYRTDADIDSRIEWDKVEMRIQGYRHRSENFLKKNIPGDAYRRNRP
jgi:Polysaccharide pyruvyl transferase.